MEYRGYDSAGLEVEGDEPGKPLIFKEVGKVAMLKDSVNSSSVDMTKTFLSQTSIAHTRSVLASLEDPVYALFLTSTCDVLLDGLLTVFPRPPTATLT
jgi:glucosamine--fructose-6-phosphate aminotransferase (isomerizing)